MTPPKPSRPRKRRPKKQLEEQIRDGVCAGIHDFLQDLTAHFLRVFPLLKDKRDLSAEELEVILTDFLMMASMHAPKKPR